MAKAASAWVIFCALSIACNSQQSADGGPAVPVAYPEIVRTLDHDSLAFTQGLLWHDGFIFESTGLRGQSSLRKINPESGEVLTSIPVRQVFAEGLAFMRDRLVQLTWQSGIALVYSYPEMQLTGTLHYEGEGWGLTVADGEFVMSNGGSVLSWRAGNFDITRTMPVTLEGKPLERLNELEWARGYIFANVWYSDYIFQIDPSSGKVVRIVNCEELVDRAGPVSEQDALNGIAWRPDTDLFYLTGKNWPHVFEVRIAPLTP
jgi:glutamine cyclotransferase